MTGINLQIVGGSVGIILVALLLGLVGLLAARGYVKRESFNTLIFLLLTVGAIILAIVYHNDFPDGSQPQQRAARPSDKFPSEVAKMAVLQRLRDPTSAVFGDISVYDDRKLKGKNVVFACGTVNAKNGFGGYTGARQFVVLQEGYRTVMDNDSDNSAFVTLWNGLCAGKHS